MSGSGGAAPSGGVSAGLGGGASGGGAQATGGQATSGGSPQTGGASSGGASGGADASGGSPAGGDESGGVPGSGGTDGAGGASSTACSRALLQQVFDDYLTALSSGSPSGLPLSPALKFTENAEEAELGSTDFWANAGAAKHSQTALDVEQCSVGGQAVIPEGGVDRPVAIRIKVQDALIHEIETIVVRPGDYSASFAVDSDPAAIIAIAGDIGWDEPVPEPQRATRQELTSWMDKYFRAFPSGVCNVTSACRRLENGGGNFSCGTGASCSATDPGTGGTFIPRVILADEERGIAVGLTIFDFQTTGHLDMHMMKMSGGEVHAVHAILRNTNGESGWD